MEACEGVAVMVKVGVVVGVGGLGWNMDVILHDAIIKLVPKENNRDVIQFFFLAMYVFTVYPQILYEAPNGLRYLRWGGDGEAVQPEKGSGVENCLKTAQNPQRQVHALLGVFAPTRTKY
ncbi:MAG: hypothetical protein U0V02_07150 [Anaerolineales bacterium]